MTTNKCRNCRFFEAGDYGGTCKRRAPQVYGQHGNSKWPATHGHWWCGEFVPTVLTEVGSGFRELTEKAPQVALSTTQDRIDADMAKLSGFMDMETLQLALKQHANEVLQIPNNPNPLCKGTFERRKNIHDNTTSVMYYCSDCHTPSAWPTKPHKPDLESIRAEAESADIPEND